MENTEQFDFLTVRIQEILDQNGFSDISEELRDQYVPQFVAEAQRRLGLAMMPFLDEKSAKELVQLVQSDASAEKMQEFWTWVVPNFEEVATKTLEDYAQEIKSIVSTL